MPSFGGRLVQLPPQRGTWGILVLSTKFKPRLSPPVWPQHAPLAWGKTTKEDLFSTIFGTFPPFPANPPRNRNPNWGFPLGLFPKKKQKARFLPPASDSCPAGPKEDKPKTPPPSPADGVFDPTLVLG